MLGNAYNECQQYCQDQRWSFEWRCCFNHSIITVAKELFPQSQIRGPGEFGSASVRVSSRTHPSFVLVVVHLNMF